MNELILVRPAHMMTSALSKYRQEYFDCGETHINGSSGMECFADAREWIDYVSSLEYDTVNDDGVHASTFVSVQRADGRIIGSVQLRHTLTPDTERHAGHIGYGIRPSERRRGYGRQQLLLALSYARRLGIPRVMLSCETTNTASAKTIASCGGVLTSEGICDGEEQQIYWIEL